jgi:hypothetical protein
MRIRKSYYNGTTPEDIFEIVIRENEAEIVGLTNVITDQELNLSNLKKLLKKLQSTVSPEKFFINLKNDRKNIIHIFHEYINEIIISKMNAKYVYIEIFLSIDGERFMNSIKLFLDMGVPRKKSISMTYDLVDMADNFIDGTRRILPHIRKGSIADIFNTHETFGFDKVFQKKFKIYSTNKYYVPDDNIFKLPITFEKEAKD